MAKRVALYGILSALCLCLSFLESLVPLSFIAVGVKLGLANSVALLLILKNDVKGAFAVNIIRILLSTLLFGAPLSLLFSLTAGITSTLVMCLVSKINKFGVIGFSIIGALTHNLAQSLVALIIFGKGVLFYLPILILSAVISGSLIGFLVKILNKKIKPLF